MQENKVDTPSLRVVLEVANLRNGPGKRDAYGRFTIYGPRGKGQTRSATFGNVSNQTACLMLIRKVLKEAVGYVKEGDMVLEIPDEAVMAWLCGDVPAADAEFERVVEVQAMMRECGALMRMAEVVA